MHKKLQNMVLLLLLVIILHFGCQSGKEQIECYCPTKIVGITSDTIFTQISVNRGDSAFIKGNLLGQAKLSKIKKIIDLNGQGGISGGYNFYEKVDSIIKVKNQPIDQRCITELDKISERCCNQYQIWRNDSLPEEVRSFALERYLQVEDQYYARLEACLAGNQQRRSDMNDNQSDSVEEKRIPGEESMVKKPSTNVPIKKTKGDTEKVDQELMTVAIITDPEGARIYINDIYYGQSNRDVSIPKGEFNLRIEKLGFQDYTDLLNSNRQTIVSVKLDK